MKLSYSENSSSSDEDNAQVAPTDRKIKTYADAAAAEEHLEKSTGDLYMQVGQQVRSTTNRIQRHIDFSASIVKKLNKAYGKRDEGLILLRELEPVPPLQSDPAGGGYYYVTTNCTLAPEEKRHYQNQGTLQSDADPGTRIVILWFFDAQHGIDPSSLPEVYAGGDRQALKKAIDDKRLDGACYFKSAEKEYLIPNDMLEVEVRDVGMVQFRLKGGHRLDSFEFKGDLHNHLAGHRGRTWEEELKDRQNEEGS